MVEWKTARKGLVQEEKYLEGGSLGEWVEGEVGLRGEIEHGNEEFSKEGENRKA
jgi:hypothetical protein